MTLGSATYLSDVIPGSQSATVLLQRRAGGYLVTKFHTLQLLSVPGRMRRVVITLSDATCLADVGEGQYDDDSRAASSQ